MAEANEPGRPKGEDLAPQGVQGATRTSFELALVPWTWERFGEAAELRYEVLHAPFGVPPSDDWDDDDPASRHLVAIDSDDAVVGYARLILRGSEAQIRQVAVAADAQRSGVGTALIEALVEEARRSGGCDLWLNARVSAIPFYERLGFEAVGDVFVTGRTGLPHRRMKYLDV